MIRVPTHALLDLGSEEDVLQVKQLDLESNGSPDLQFSFGSYASWGSKKSQEDRVFAQDLSGVDAFAGASRVVALGVFDGHNGDEAAEYLQAHFVSRLLDVLQALRAYMDQQQQQPGSHISDEAAGATDGDSSAVVSPTAIGSRHQGSRPSRSPSSHQLLVGCGSNQFDYGSVLRGTLLSLESELLAAGLQAGSTALVALLVDGTLFLANVGDCRAVVSDDAEARVLTWDHKPSSHARERERVESQGATVTEDGYVQLKSTADVLMLSRALGDAHLKAQPPPVQLLPVATVPLLQRPNSMTSPQVPLTTVHSGQEEYPGMGAEAVGMLSADPVGLANIRTSTQGALPTGVAGVPPSPDACATNCMPPTIMAELPVALSQGPTSPSALPPPLLVGPLLSQSSAGLALCRSCSVSSCQSLDTHSAAAAGANLSHTSTVAPAVLTPGSMSGAPPSLVWPVGRPALVIPAVSSAGHSMSGIPAASLRYRSDNGSQAGGMPETAYSNSNSLTQLMLQSPGFSKAAMVSPAADGGAGADITCAPLTSQVSPGQQQEVPPAGGADDCSVTSGHHSPEPASSLPSAAPSPAPDSERVLSPAGSMQPQVGDGISVPGGAGVLSIKDEPGEPAPGSSFQSKQATSSVLGLIPLPSLQHASEPGQAGVWGSALPPLHHQSSGVRPLVPTSSSGALNLGGVCAACNKPLVAVLCSPGAALSAAAVNSPSRSSVSPRLKGSPSQPALLMPTGNNSSGNESHSVSASGALPPGGASSGTVSVPSVSQFRLPFSLPSMFMRRSGQQVPPVPPPLQLQTSGSGALSTSRAGSLSASLPGVPLSPPEVSPSPGVVIPDPDVIQYAVHQESEFVILASDGVWDTLKNLEAVTKVRRWMMDGMTPEEAARELVNTALKLGSTDNASAVILRFSSRPLPRPQSNSMLRRARSEAVLPPAGSSLLTGGGASSSGAGGGLGASFSQLPASASALVPSLVGNGASAPSLNTQQPRSPNGLAALNGRGSAPHSPQFLLPHHRSPPSGAHNSSETSILSNGLLTSRLMKSTGGSATTILEEGGHQAPPHPDQRLQPQPHQPWSSSSAGHITYSPTGQSNQSRMPGSPAGSSSGTAPSGALKASPSTGSAAVVGGGGPIDAHTKGVWQLLPYLEPV